MIVLTILGGLVLMVLGSIFNGYALSILWGWFMVTTLKLPALSIVQAIGIALIVRFLTVQYDPQQENQKGFGEIFFKSLMLSFLHSAFALFVGWIIHFFM